MSQSGTQQTISETIEWHGDWQTEISQQQRGEAQRLFAEMMADYPPSHMKHIKDHVCEAIQTVLDQAECCRGRLNETGPIFEFSFEKEGIPLYLTALFLDGGRGICLTFSNFAPTSATI